MITPTRFTRICAQSMSSSGQLRYHAFSVEADRFHRGSRSHHQNGDEIVLRNHTRRYSDCLSDSGDFISLHYPTRHGDHCEGLSGGDVHVNPVLRALS